MCVWRKQRTKSPTDDPDAMYDGWDQFNSFDHPRYLPVGLLVLTDDVDFGGVVGAAAGAASAGVEVLSAAAAGAWSIVLEMRAQMLSNESLPM